MKRLRGGFRGLLAAFDAGIADELSAAEPHRQRTRRDKLSKAEARAAVIREERRVEAYARRKALADERRG